MFLHFKKQKTCALWVRGLLQATAVALYCLLTISLIHFFATDLDNSFLAPLLALLMFSTSAMICAVLVLYRPYELFVLENQKAQAAHLVVWTAVWLFVYLIGMISVVELIGV